MKIFLTTLILLSFSAYSNDNIEDFFNQDKTPAECTVIFESGIEWFEKGAARHEEGFRQYELAVAESRRSNADLYKICGFLKKSWDNFSNSAIAFGISYDNFTPAAWKCDEENRIIAANNQIIITKRKNQALDNKTAIQDTRDDLKCYNHQ